MARPPVSPIDPAADAAGLLRRLGFAILMLAMPLAALITRRGVVALAPIGVALLVIASVLDGEPSAAGDAERDRRVRRRHGIRAPVRLVRPVARLDALSRARGGTARQLAATLGVVFAGYLALPDRMRSANLYLLPVGVAVAAVAAIGLGLFGSGGGWAFKADGQSLARGLVVLVLFVWPSVAWLRSREAARSRRSGSRSSWRWQR